MNNNSGMKDVNVVVILKISHPPHPIRLNDILSEKKTTRIITIVVSIWYQFWYSEGGVV